MKKPTDPPQAADENVTTSSVTPGSTVPRMSELTKEQIERARRFIKLCVANADGNRSKAFRALNLQQGTGDKLLNRQAAGFKTIETIAKAASLPVDLFLHGAPRELEIVLFHHPNRWGKHTIVAVLHMAQRIEHPLTRTEWIDLLAETEDRLAVLLSEIQRKKT